MKKYKILERPLPDERELVINLHLNEDNEWQWEVDTNIPKYINMFKKRGWTQTTECTLQSDGSIQGATFISKEKKPITFRDLTKLGNKREMSEEHLAKLRNGLARYKSNYNSET